MASEEDYFLNDNALTLGTVLGLGLDAVTCKACGALVSKKYTKFHYEFHVANRDMPKIR